jgi:hypothetical protein
VHTIRTAPGSFYNLLKFNIMAGNPKTSKSTSIGKAAKATTKGVRKGVNPSAKTSSTAPMGMYKKGGMVRGKKC